MGERHRIRAQYTETTPTSQAPDSQQPADLALKLSRRLIAVMKLKSIINIEAGLAMIALAMSISSQVGDRSFKKIAVIDFYIKELWRVSGISCRCQNSFKQVETSLTRKVRH
jgi:hypothetical protein